MGTKTGEMRESLMDCIELVKAGKLDPAKATAIAKLAGQVSLSMQVEANVRLEALRQPLGAMPIGEEQPRSSLLERIE
jgi:hypothetical protein